MKKFLSLSVVIAMTCTASAWADATAGGGIDSSLGGSATVASSGIGLTGDYYYKSGGAVAAVEAGGVISPSGQAHLVGRASLSAPMFGIDEANSISFGDPVILYSDGQYFQGGASPTCIFLFACGFTHVNYTPNGTQIFTANPRLMAIHDALRQLDMVGLGGQFYVNAAISPRIDFEGFAQLAGVENAQAAGLFYNVQAGLKYLLNPGIALTASAGVSDLAYNKTMSLSPTSTAPSIIGKVGVQAAL